MGRADREVDDLQGKFVYCMEVEAVICGEDGVGFYGSFVLVVKEIRS